MLLLKGGKRRMRAWEAMNVDVSVSVCVEARRIFFDDVDLGLARAAVKKNLQVCPTTELVKT